MFAMPILAMFAELIAADWTSHVACFLVTNVATSILSLPDRVKSEPSLFFL